MAPGTLGIGEIGQNRRFSANQQRGYPLSSRKTVRKRDRSGCVLRLKTDTGGHQNGSRRLASHKKSDLTGNSAHYRILFLHSIQKNTFFFIETSRSGLIPKVITFGDPEVVTFDQFWGPQMSSKRNFLQLRVVAKVIYVPLNFGGE